MPSFPLQQPPSGPGAVLRPRPRRLRTLHLLAAYWGAYLLLHVIALALMSREGVLLWFLPAALSVGLLLMLGPKALPAVILGPLPVDLVLRPMGLPPVAVIGLSVVFGISHALAVAAFRRLGCSPRLRRSKDVGGFLVMAALGPLLAALPVYGLLWAFSELPAERLMSTTRAIFLGDALGVLTLGPALLQWARPHLVLWGHARWPAARPSFEALLQGLSLVLSAILVAHFSLPGTLHLKYLFFLPLFWVVVRGGTRAASLAFPLLAVSLTLALQGRGVPPDALMGLQAFLAMLFGAALFLGAAVDAREAAQSVQDRGTRRLRQLVACTGAVAWDMDLETGRCGYLGRATEALFGWPQEAWRSKPFWGEVIHPEDQLAFLRFLLDLGRPEGIRQLEFRLRRPEGGDHWVRAAGGLEPGRAHGLVMGFLFDIHAQKQVEQDALRHSLKEKDLLLREIHHRVKNNLQVVSSLLRLQAASHGDPAVQQALKEAQERIQAIALIHQKLKHAPDFSGLDLEGYVRTLAERLVRSYASVPALVDLQVRVAEVALGPDAPVPLGLILNELVANALTHAFPPGEGGSLDIEVALDRPGWVSLRVADSGCGLPEGVDLEHGGLGFQLVKALTDQLRGTLELERRRGASFLLTFPASPHLP